MVWLFLLHHPFIILHTLPHILLMLFTDYQPMIQLVSLLLETYIAPCTREAENKSTELTDKILHLLLRVLDGLFYANDFTTISRISVQWASVFNLRNTR